VDLPAFSWLVRNSVPALLFAIPVVFAPEIRRALERIGRAGNFLPNLGKITETEFEQSIHAVVTAAARLSARQHGALIIMQRLDNLDEYIESGVRMNATVTAEVLLQIFYPNTPLHDGAAILSGPKLVAAACVMPLSSSGILNRSPERQMGLRHRAALGISEESDAIAVVVSEETGAISIAHAGRMIRRIDPDRLENILLAFFQPSALEPNIKWFERLFPYFFTRKDKRDVK
jgi:diadenylate cyclase